MAPADPVGGDSDAALPERPRRHYLRDDELVSELGDASASGSTLGAIDRLQAELELRAADARVYREWELRMRGIGTRAAAEAVEAARREFADVVPPPQVAAPPRRIVPERLTAPRMVVFAPTVGPAGRPPPPTYDESHEILFEAGIPPVPPPPPAPAPTVDLRLPGRRESALEPPHDDQRIGRASSLFWLWFAGNASLLSVVVGAALFSLGMSLRQSLLATIAGVAVATIPIAVATLAGRLTGQPTVVVSRAVFGVVGNAGPAVIALVSRVFWGAVLLWILSASVARVLVVSRLAAGEVQLTVAVLALVTLAAGAVALLGHRVIVRLHLAVTALSALLVVGFVALTAGRLDLRVALTIGDGPWILVVSGAVIVFSVFGLLWANAAGDLTRHQSAVSSGASSVSWASAGAVVPALVLVGYGALLTASDPASAGAFLASPVDAIASLLPVWYPLPLIVAIALGLLSSVTAAIYSGAFALQSVGPPVDRRVAVGVVSVAVAVVGVVAAVFVIDFGAIVRDVATTVAVPVAAWMGLLATGLLVRRSRVDPAALLRRGGRHPDLDIRNVVFLVVAIVVGYGLTTAAVGWLGWQGYLFSLLEVPLDSDLASSDLGVFVALAIGLVAPLFVAGDPGQDEPVGVEPSVAPEGRDGPDDSAGPVAPAR